MNSTQASGTEPLTMRTGFVFKRAKPSAKTLAQRLASGKYRYTDEGELEKRCSRCKEYWPADNEFYYAGKGLDGLIERCKACAQEVTRLAPGRPWEKTAS